MQAHWRARPSIHISNVVLVDSDTGEVGRVRWRELEDGARVRTGQRSTQWVSSNGTATLDTPRLLSRYRSDVIPVLTREFGYTNPMQLPNLAKIIVNIGLGEAIDNSNALDAASNDIATITGQKAIVNRAKKVNRELQIAGRDAYWRLRHVAIAQNVAVL